MAKEKKAKASKAKGKKAVASDDIDGTTVLEFDIGSMMDDQLDLIEKKTKVSSQDAARHAPRIPTGLLALDMYLDGGIVPGGWYTFSGGEQSCKSTMTMSIMASLIKLAYSGISVVFDYEGCVVGDTKIRVLDGVSGSSGREINIRDVLSTVADPQDGVFYPVSGTVMTAEGFKKYTQARVKKDRPITKIEAKGGLTLRGYHHPVLILNADYLLEWKMIEDITVGDKVLSHWSV